MRLIYENKAAGGTAFVNTGAEDSAYPPANLLSGELHPECRVTENAPSNVIIIGVDLGSSMTLRGVLLAESDLVRQTPAAGVLWRGSPSTNFFDAGAVLPTGSTYGWSAGSRHWYQLSDADVSGRYHLLRFSGLDDGATYRFGDLWLITENGLTPLSRTHVQDSDLAEHGGSYEEVVTAGGVRWTYVHYRQKRLPALRWELLRAAELAELQAVHEACWPNGTLWIDRSIDGNPPDWMFARYVSASFNRSRINPGYYSCEMAFEEVPEPNYEA